MYHFRFSLHLKCGEETKMQFKKMLSGELELTYYKLTYPKYSSAQLL